MTDKPETVRPTAIHDLNALAKAEVDQLLIRTEQDLGPFLELVEPIIAAVKTDGDQALVHFAAKLDGAQIGLGEIALSESELQEAENSQKRQSKWTVQQQQQIYGWTYRSSRNRSRWR